MSGLSSVSSGYHILCNGTLRKLVLSLKGTHFYRAFSFKIKVNAEAMDANVISKWEDFSKLENKHLYVSGEGWNY